VQQQNLSKNKGDVLNGTVIMALFGLFIITALTNILATLKSMLLSKKIMNPVYLLAFVDAIIFAAVVNKVTSSQGIKYTLSYALGRTFGVYIGNKIEELIALGILEVDLFLKHKEKMIEIAEKLRNEGYTVNNYIARGINGDRRYKVEVVIKRKEMKILEDIIDQCGVSNPTLKIKNLSRINGKITSTRVKTT
jgi:uncharacterized protein YebE (UPF0316 family)